MTMRFSNNFLVHKRRGTQDLSNRNPSPQPFDFYVSLSGNDLWTGTIATNNNWQVAAGQNPSFVDAPNGNYHLNSGSPVGNLGPSLTPVTVNGITYNFDRDRDGVTRTFPSDLGAYEIV